ncbi:MAG TPA: hypothetical protein PKJ41_07455 [Bryobacteraceae bacterium]|nr:hypothetical protein [Bryobacteraceae bacterium]
MKTLVSISLMLCLLCGIAFAAAIDGKWYSERKMNRDGQEFVIKTTFDLKSDGAKLTGTLTMAFGDMEPRSIPISDGKIDGAKFSFTTVMQTPNGEFKSTYDGTVEGDMIKGTSAREGGEPRPFEAKRQ